jgi:hypothetical protein
LSSVWLTSASADCVVCVCRSPAIQRPAGSGGTALCGSLSPPQAAMVSTVAMAAGNSSFLYDMKNILKCETEERAP